MCDLSTDYCGLSLSSPLVVSASPLTAEVDTALSLQQAGAGAIVMPSLFEESVSQHPTESNKYLSKLSQLKAELSIPVIASLNGVTEGGWLEHASRLEDAGCDALELNIYYLAANVQQTGDMVERHYIDLVYKLRSQIKVPIAVKLCSQFTAVANLVKRLEETGIDGVVIFNRYYLPDIDIESIDVKPFLSLSHPSEALMRVRWLAILREQVKLSLAATGGFHGVNDIIKALLAGADVVQLCSVLMEQGVEQLADILAGIKDWGDEKGFADLAEFKGKLSYANAADPSAYERHNYYQALTSSIK